MDQLGHVRFVQASTVEQLEQILKLQQANLPKNLSPSETRTQGFLTVEHHMELLRTMNNAFPHTLAIAQDTVVGYALSMHPNFREDIAVLRPMFLEIDQVYSGKDYMVMGQICVAKSHRGKGVFRGLYLHMLHFIQPQYKSIITEVDTRNLRSMAAHQAIGFRELSRYSNDGKEWSLVILD